VDVKVGRRDGNVSDRQKLAHNRRRINPGFRKGRGEKGRKGGKVLGGVASAVR